MFKHNVVYNSIKEKIVIGGWYEGMLIPSETQLCEMYDVSRITIRRALKELEYSGYVKRIQGKGTFVKSSNRDAIEIIASDEKDDAISYEILECKNVAAEAEVARKLNIGEYEEVLFLKRIRYRGSKPEAYIHTWCSSLSVYDIKDYDLTSQKILSVLSDVKKKLIDAESITIKPIVPSENVCKVINLEPNSAHALLRRVSVDSEGIPCEYTKAVINSSDLEFTISSWVKQDSYKSL